MSSGMLLLDDETASKVIEKQLFGNSISFNEKFKLSQPSTSSSSSPKRLATTTMASMSRVAAAADDDADIGSGSSGSETASDEEYADNAAAFLGFVGNNKTLSLPESIAASVNSSILANNNNKSKGIIFPKNSKEAAMLDEEQDKPLNLSADSKTTSTSTTKTGGQSGTVELQASNQQIIDIYIDKLLSDSKCFTDYSGVPGYHKNNNNNNATSTGKL